MKKLSLITLVVAVICCSFMAGKNLLLNGPKFRFSANTKASGHFNVDNTEPLPKAYVNRKFLNDISGFSFDINLIPGNLVSYIPKDSSYTVRTLHGLIKGNKLPVINAVNDGLIYSDFITPTTSFNGSYLIGGIKANAGEVIELSIQDESIASVPDSLIDIEQIKAAIATVPAEERENLFYVKSITLTGLQNRLFKQSKFDATKNGLYLELNGKTYASNEKVRKDRLVSMFLVPAKNITANR